MVNLRKIVMLCTACCLMLVTVGTASAQNKKVIVAKAGNFLAWTLIDLAKAKGFFTQHGLDIEILAAQGGPQVLAAVLAGRAHFSTTSILELIEANLQGQKARIVSPLLRQSQVACAVRKDIASQFPPASASWSDRVMALRGKQIGVTSVGGGVSLTLNYMLRGSGMTERDVVQTAIGADPAAWVAALKNKQLDAMCAGVPIPEETMVQGVSELYVSPALGDVPALAGIPDATAVTTQDVIDRDPDLVQKFVAALFDAQKFMQQNREEAGKIIKQEVFPNLKQETFDLGFKHFEKAFATSPRITQAEFQRALDYASFIKNQPVKLSIDDVYASRFAQALGQ